MKKNTMMYHILLILVVSAISMISAQAATVPNTVDPQPSSDRMVAEDFAKQTPVYKAKGSDLKFVTETPTSQGTAFTFTYLTKDNGFGTTTSYYASSMSKPKFTRTLVVTVKDGQVVSAVLDKKWDEITHKSLTSSKFSARYRGTLGKTPTITTEQSKARAIAEVWLKNAPTFKADGFSLNFVTWTTELKNANAFIFTYDFKSRQPGYGARKSYTSNQVTGHRIIITVENGKVTKAIIDEKWDELLQKEHTTGKNTDLVIMRFHPKQCEQTPWQQWYKEEQHRFNQRPSEESLIAGYYNTVYSFTVSNIHKISSTTAACNACGCPLHYYFETQVKAKHETRFKNQGWVRV